MYVLTVEKLDEKNMDFTIVFFMRHFYKDPRLVYTPDPLSSTEPIVLSSLSKLIWTPDSYVVNNKDQSVDHEHTMLRIYPDGSVFFSKRFNVRATCKMDLRKFPMDEQRCGIEIESFSYSEESVILTWMSEDSSKSIEIHSIGLWMVRFDIEQWQLKQSKVKYGKRLQMQYSKLEVDFLLSRKVLFFILQFHIPTILIVITSWISFWVDDSSIPGRVALSITTVLAMTTLMYGVQSSLPQVPYTKAIDIFLIVSFLFVFSALIEFAVLNFHQKNLVQEKGKHHHAFIETNKECEEQNKQTEMNEFTNKETTSYSNNHKERNSTSETDLRKRDKKIRHFDESMQSFQQKNNPRVNTVDRVSRVAFPLLFFIFNLVYWVGFLAI